MRVKMVVPSAKGKTVKEKIQPHVHIWESEDWDSDFEATVLIDPGSFRIIDDILRKETRGQGSFDVVSVAVAEETVEQLE